MLGKWTFTLAVLSLVVCGSCESKPVVDAKPGKAVGGKATRGGAPSTAVYSALLEIDDSQSPRKIAGPVFYNPAVQNCLRAALMKSGDDFSVSVSGNLSAKGAVSDVAVEHQFDSLRDCLGRELTKMNFGPGAAGAFKLAISRSRTTPSSGKTYELDLNAPGKFQ
jgi:hypothetical protein